jgi:co-chaperonin GroES (HSP10)
MQVIAANDYVLIVRDPAQTQQDVFDLPDESIKETNQGEIKSVGRLVRDRGTIKSGSKAIWNKHAGFAIKVDDVEYTVLHEHEIIGIL